MTLKPTETFLPCRLSLFLHVVTYRCERFQIVQFQIRRATVQSTAKHVVHRFRVIRIHSSFVPEEWICNNTRTLCCSAHVVAPGTTSSGSCLWWWWRRRWPNNAANNSTTIINSNTAANTATTIRYSTVLPIRETCFDHRSQCSAYSVRT